MWQLPKSIRPSLPIPPPASCPQGPPRGGTWPWLGSPLNLFSLWPRLWMSASPRQCLGPVSRASCGSLGAPSGSLSSFSSSSSFSSFGVFSDSHLAFNWMKKSTAAPGPPRLLLSIFAGVVLRRTLCFLRSSGALLRV